MRIKVCNIGSVNLLAGKKKKSGANSRPLDAKSVASANRMMLARLNEINEIKITKGEKSDGNKS